MWDSIIVGIIIALCAFLIGRKIYRQLKAAADPSINLECSCGCSGNCPSSACSDRRKKNA